MEEFFREKPLVTPTWISQTRYMGIIPKVLNHIEQTTLSSPFDRRSLPVYQLIAAKAVVGLMLFLWLGFSITSGLGVFYLAWPAIIAAGWMLRRLNVPRLGGALEAFAILYGQGLLAVLTLAVGASLGGPYVDDSLSMWDQALGFSWPTFIEFFRPYVAFLSFAYSTFIWQGWVLVFLLFYLKQEHRAWVFVTAATLAMLCLDVLFPLFPAKAAFIHYGVMEFEGQNVAYSFLQPLEYLRGGGREINPGMITGMVTFPSYHASSAIFFIYAAWRTGLRWPFVLLNIALLIATIEIGGHYLIDLIAGIALAMVSLVAANFLVRRYSIETVAGEDVGRSVGGRATAGHETE